MLNWLRHVFHRIGHQAKRFGGPITFAPPQQTKALVFQVGAIAVQNGTSQIVDGYNGGATIEVVNTGTGTGTVIPQGSIDNVNWYNLGYQRVDAVAVPARAVGGFAVAAGSRAVLQILDYYEYLQVPITAVTPPVVITVSGVAVPMH